MRRHDRTRVARTAHAAGRPWTDLVRTCLSQLDGLVDRHGIGIVFMADPTTEMADHVLDHLRRGTGIETWVGGGGEGVLCGAREIHGEGGLVIMCLPMDRARYRLIGGKRGDGLGLEAGVTLLHLARDDAAWAPDCGMGAMLVGGCVSSAFDAAQVAGSVCSGGLRGLAFDGEAEIVVGAMRGSQALGPWRRVTAAGGRQLRELDDRPATELLREDAGEVLFRQREQLFRRVVVECGDLPGDAGRSHQATIAGIDAAGRTITLDTDRLRPWVRFAHREACAARAELDEVVAGLLAATPPDRPPRAAIFYGSTARGEALFGPGVSEAAMLQAALGPIPLVGLRTSAEIFDGELIRGAGVLCLIG